MGSIKETFPLFLFDFFYFLLPISYILLIMSDLNLKINTSTIVKIVFILAVFYFLYIIRDLVLIILTSVVIASAVEPATKWMGRFRISRLPAVVIMYVLGTLAFFGVLYLFVPPLLSQASQMLSALPHYIESFNLKEASVDTGLINTKGAFESISSVVSLGDILNSLRELASTTSSNVLQTATAIFGGVTSFILIVIFSFYLAVQENGIDHFLRIITPIKHEDRVIDLWRRSQAKIGRWMQGQLLLVVVIGVLVYLGLIIIGIPHALLLAAIAGLMELIPLFGPVIAAVPAFGVAFLEGGLALGVVVIGLYVIIQQFENHLIYPLVVKKVVGVPAIVVIIALIAGGKLAGFLGIILAVPAAAVLQELSTNVQQSKRLKFEQEQKEAKEENS